MMSLLFALEAAVSGPTGPRAILLGCRSFGGAYAGAGMTPRA
jgi:hypothetical protein